MRPIWDLCFNILMWTVFAVSVVPLFFVALAIRILTAPFDPNRRVLQRFSCLWASFYIWVNPFWQIRVKGLEHVDRRKVYVMISNHQSMADILVVYRTLLHFKWVSKDILFKTPFLGWNMILNGYVPIKRGDAESRKQCMQACRAWLDKGSSVFFFPEGTRSETGAMRPFKLGAFQLALDSGVDILPMVIRGSREALPKHSALIHTHSDMEIEVLPPIAVRRSDSQEAAVALADETRTAIAKAVKPQLS